MASILGHVLPDIQCSSTSISTARASLNGDASLGENAGHVGPTFPFTVESFQYVARALRHSMTSRQAEDGERLRDVCFHPIGELGRRRGILLDDHLQTPIRFGAVRRRNIGTLSERIRDSTT